MKKFMFVVLMLALSVPAMADTGGAVAGALIGGAIGSKVGGGNGKKALIVLGALAGANIGSRVEDGTYGRNADGDFVCVNCGNTQTAYQQPQYRSAGEEAAAHRGAADRQAREQAYLEQRAYCDQNPQGCGNGGYGGHNYAGSYNNRNIQWR